MNLKPMQNVLNQCKEDISKSTNEIILEEIKVNEYVSEERLLYMTDRLIAIHALSDNMLTRIDGKGLVVKKN